MDDEAELEKRLRTLAGQIESAQAKYHELVLERNDVMRELNRLHGLKPTQLAQLARLKSRQLADRIVKGENR